MEVMEHMTTVLDDCEVCVCVCMRARVCVCVLLSLSVII